MTGVRTMEDIKVININLDKKFPKEGELMGRISKLIDEYVGELSLVSVIGILELKKMELIHD